MILVWSVCGVVGFGPKEHKTLGEGGRGGFCSKIAGAAGSKYEYGIGGGCAGR